MVYTKKWPERWGGRKTGGRRYNALYALRWSVFGFRLMCPILWSSDFIGHFHSNSALQSHDSANQGRSAVLCGLLIPAFLGNARKPNFPILSHGRARYAG